MKKFLVALFALLCTPAAAQNYLRDDGIFHSVVEGTTSGQVLVNSGGLLAGSTGVPITIGVTPISSGSNSKTLFNNSSFVGEYQPNVPAVMVCDGVTDNTFVIQTAWTLAAARSVNVWLNATGTGSCLFSQVVQPTPTGMGKGSFLTGPGASILKLVSTVTGTNCAITINVTYGVNAYLNGAFQGFTLQQSALNQTGRGICVNGVAQTIFKDVTVQYFDIGMYATDTILTSLLESRFYQNNTALSAAIVSSSAPNGWAIQNSHFVGNKQSTIILNNPGLVNIFNNEFESNGGLTSAFATIDVVEGAVSGGAVVGINVAGNYFEDNRGREVRLNKNGGLTNTIHSVNNNLFGRSTALLLGAVLIINDNASAFTTVNVGGNSFTDGIGGSFSWIAAQTPATTNYTFNCSVSNRNDNAAAMPVACRNSAANLAVISDSSNQYIGLSTVPVAALTNSATTVNGQTCMLGSTCTITAAATAVAIGTTTITSGTTGRILYDNAGVLGELPVGTGVATALSVNVGSAGAFVVFNGALGTPLSGVGTNLTALNASNISSGVLATARGGAGGVTGALKGDGSGQVSQAACADLSNGGVFCSGTDAANLTGTVASARLSGSYTGITGVGTLVAGATGAGFTVALATSTITGNLPIANAPSIATNTILGNATSGTATVTALAVGSCDTSTKAMQWTTNTGFGCNTAINAATLGGATFAAPGTIGGGTPGAITGTTITANTSISSPIHTSSGSHTFQSNGSTFAGLITTGQLWFIGPTSLTPAAGSQLTVSQNTGGTPATSAIGNILGQYIAADSAIGTITLDIFGNQGVFASRYSGGTQASKSATGGNTNTFSGAAQGWDTTAFVTGAAQEYITTATTWDTTHHGMAVRWRTTADTVSATLTERMRIGSGLMVGNTTDPGAGIVSATGGYVANGLAGITTVCTIAVGNVLTFTLGILTAKGGVAGCT